MIISKKLSSKCLHFIQNNTSILPEDLEKINYGLLVIWVNLFKFIILFVTAYFLGMLRYAFAAFMFFGILRTFASGVHANSTLQCISINYALFLGNPYLSLFLPLNIVTRFIIFLVSLLLVVLYAPADTEDRPLVSQKLRRKLKLESVAITIILYLLSLIIKNYIYRNIIIFSILEGALLITPAAYKLLGKKYANYKDMTI